MYSQEHKLLQQSIKKFAEKEILPHISKWEEDKFFPSNIFKKLGNEGFLGILMDEQWGGVGGDFLMAAAWCEEFGRVPSVGFSVAVNMHSLVITPTLARYGSDIEKEKWLANAVAGDAIGAYAFTEPGAGSDLSAIRTKAVKDGSDYLLTGSKIFITNGARADFVLVLAVTDPTKGYEGFSTFVVDTKLPGFSVSRKLEKIGWHCSDTAELNFDAVRLPATALLGQENQGWKQAMQSLEWERLMLTLTSIAGARKCLEETAIYVQQRKVFGKRVIDFDYNSTLLANMVAQLDAATAQAHRCLNLLNAGQRCRKEVSLAKLYGCELAIEIANKCLQLHGGYGYTTEFLPERWLRDLRLNTIGGGTTEIMAQVAYKEML